MVEQKLKIKLNLLVDNSPVFCGDIMHDDIDVG